MTISHWLTVSESVQRGDDPESIFDDGSVESADVVTDDVIPHPNQSHGPLTDGQPSNVSSDYITENLLKVIDWDWMLSLQSSLKIKIKVI